MIVLAVEEKVQSKIDILVLKRKAKPIQPMRYDREITMPFSSVSFVPLRSACARAYLMT